VEVLNPTRSLSPMIVMATSKFFVMDADGTNVVSQIRKVRLQNLSHKGFVWKRPLFLDGVTLYVRPLGPDPKV
jgi:hypothetical protein